MSEEQSLDIPGVGKVVFRKTTKAKRISIRVKPGEGVLVAVPRRASFADAERFVLEKKEWLQNAIQKIKLVEQRKTIYTEERQQVTRSYFLELKKHDKQIISLKVRNYTISVDYPALLAVSDSRVQKAVDRGIEFALKVEAQQYLPGRVEVMAAKFSFRYKKVTVRNAKTRWGSCSFDNNINLSIHLMRLPDRLIDYVILHELCHTIHKNHGPKFWAHLDKVSGDAKGMAKEMKEYSLKFF